MTRNVGGGHRVGTVKGKKNKQPVRLTALLADKPKRVRRRRVVEPIVAEPLIEVGDRVRVIRNPEDTGTVEAVTFGDGMWPIIHVRTHKDGYIVQFNSNQLVREG
jgi:hypothetical protein